MMGLKELFDEKVKEQKQPSFILSDRFKVLVKFFGHGTFKYLGLEPGTIIDVNCLNYFGKNKRNIRNLISSNMLERVESEPTITIEWLEEFVEKGKKQPIPVKEADYKFNEAMQSFEFDFLQMAEQFHKIQPYFYDKNQIWWLWNFELVKWERIDEIDIMNRINKALPHIPKTTNSRIKNEILESMKRIGRLKIPADAPIKWIQFKDKAFSLKSNKIYKVEPNFFFTNPIPWELGDNSDTPTMDKLFKEWVGENYVQTLYEIIAYCCYRNYPIQTLFCLYGNGRNGKSQFLKILSKFTGMENLCSTDLDMLAGRNRNRFETVKLYKKLVCLMGETNFGVLDSSAIIKKLTGGDVIGFEIKGKNPFDDYNYAKILIASNSLPTSEDTSEGFYRRWVIIDFPNQFKEGKDIIETIPEIEYSNLANKVTKILPTLISCGNFKNQGSIHERKMKYIMASNPLPMFLHKFCDFEINAYVRYSELFTVYCQFLDKIKRRVISRKEFGKCLDIAGYESHKTSHDGDIAYYINGLKLKSNWKQALKEQKVFLDFPDFSKCGISSLYMGTDMQNVEIEEIGENQKTPQEMKVIHHKCSLCGYEPSAFWDKKGQPICEVCYQTLLVNKELSE